MVPRKCCNRSEAASRNGGEIIGAKSYVCEWGKSMNAVELATSQKGCWRNIAISLVTRRLQMQMPGFARLRLFSVCRKKAAPRLGNGVPSMRFALQMIRTSPKLAERRHGRDGTGLHGAR